MRVMIPLLQEALDATERLTVVHADAELFFENAEGGAHALFTDGVEIEAAEGG